MSLRSPAFLCLLALGSAAEATTVYVTSVGYTAVQVIINGSAVHSLQIGETSPEGVRVENIEGGTAVLEVDRQLVRLTLGQTFSPDVVLRVAPDGAFRVTAYVNGVALRGMIDTGASAVAMSSATAQRLGIDYLRGRRGESHTANGTIPSWRVNIPRMQVGEIVLANVVGSVTEGITISKDTDLLIGNSFLQHVHLQRTGNSMIIRR